MNQPTAETAPPLPAFSYQLVDAYLYDCSIKRRPSTEQDPPQPKFVTRFEVSESADLPGGFIAKLIVEVSFRFRPEAVCEFAVATSGHFARIGDLGSEADTRFRREDCAVLLWPYARAHVGELSRMLGIGLPPLPTVDVRQVMNVDAPSAPE